MNTLKMMLGGGGDVAELAEMIRRFGRGRDKILAHITPEEAIKLKEMGGSGKINPMTGLPEFQDEYDPNMDIGFGPGQFTPDYTSEDVAGMSQEQFERFVPTEAPNFSYQPAMNYGAVSRPGEGQPSFLPPDALQEMEMADQEAAALSPVGGRQVTPEEEGVFGRAERGLQELRGTLDRYPNLTRIGGAGANLVAQALLAQRANRQRQAEAERLRGRAQPFRAAEQEAMARATGGGLTPQQARELEIAQGRARQGLSAGNQAAGSAAAGILAGQATRARSAARQESLETALQLAGIADRYERQAIQEELARDKELADLFAQVIGREIQAASRTQAPQGRG
jgi:hypothetical protein